MKDVLCFSKLFLSVFISLRNMQTPGEAEYKIMSFIRAERSREDYDPNTRHVYSCGNVEMVTYNSVLNPLNTRLYYVLFNCLFIVCL